MTGGAPNTRVVQITNIAPQATKDQMQSLFGHIGKIEEIRLYPTIRDVSCPVLSRICYVKYYDSSCVAVAQHLTNTVFIDRALIVIPIQNGVIPDEYKALEMSNNGTIVPGVHTPDSKLPPEVVNKLEGQVPNQVIMTIDPKLEINNLPEYPALPVNYDAHRIEETRRTILVYDVKSDWRLEDLMDYFVRAGEVKYGRFAEKEGERFAMIEFSEQKSVIDALKLHGSEFKSSWLTIFHSTQPIVKPETKSNEAAQKEIEEAMSIVKEAQNLISAAIDPVIGMLSKDKTSSSSSRRSRSRDRERHRSRSRSKRSRSRERRRTRSRSKSKRRSRSRSRSKRSKSKSISSRKRSRSRSKRSRSKDRRRRSRSRRKSRDRSKSPRRRKSRSRDRERKRTSRDRSRDRHRDRKRSPSRRKESARHRSRSRSPSKRRSKSRDRRTKDYKSSSKRRSRTPEVKKTKRISEEKVIRDYDAEEKMGARDERDERSTSVEKSDNMDISNSP